MAIIIERLPHDPDVTRIAHVLEVVPAFLLPAATVHIAVALTVEGRISLLQRVVCVAGYAVCALAATLGAIDPALEFRVTPPQFSLPGIPGAVFGWAWIAFRLVLFAFAVYWLVLALLSAGRDQFRRRQLQAVVATVVIGALGAMVRILPGIADSDPWIGVSLIMIATVLAAYGVFGQGLFFSPDVAAAAFRYSVVVGLGITVYVALLVGLEQLARSVLAVDLPIVTALALVITIALFEPIADRVRRLMTGGTGRDVAYPRLLRAWARTWRLLSGPSQHRAGASRLTRSFRISGVELQSRSGDPVARPGRIPADDPLALSLPLRVDGEDYGTSPRRQAIGAAVHRWRGRGARAGGDLRRLVAATGQPAERAGRGAGSPLRRTRRAREHRERTHEALIQEPVTEDRLEVFALGSLRVQRGSELIARWGGEKAGPARPRRSSPSSSTAGSGMWPRTRRPR